MTDEGLGEKTRPLQVRKILLDSPAVMHLLQKLKSHLFEILEEKWLSGKVALKYLVAAKRPGKTTLTWGVRREK